MNVVYKWAWVVRIQSKCFSGCQLSPRALVISYIQENEKDIYNFRSNERRISFDEISLSTNSNEHRANKTFRNAIFKRAQRYYDDIYGTRRRVVNELSSLIRWTLKLHESRCGSVYFKIVTGVSNPLSWKLVGKLTTMAE